MSKPLNLANKKFTRILVIRRLDNDKHGKSRWLCLCDCGTQVIISGCDLNNGHTKSCGCLRQETTRQRSIKHGHNRKGKTSKIYIVWIVMKQRCTNPNDKNYVHYGGRGITVCQRWMKFENFLEDMGEVPKGLQIDRIDNDGDYCKSNCRWVTSQTNNRNKRNNRLITHNGKTKCIAEWAEKYGIKHETLRNRIDANGWSIEKALATPVRSKRKI